MAISSADKLVVVKSFAMGNPLPLDAREIYDSFAEAKAYAATSPIAYAGQTIKVVEGGNVSVFNLVPSTVEGENYALALAVSGSGAVQGVNTSSVEGNITVQTASGDTTAAVDVPVVGALINPVVNEEEHTLTLTKVGATADKNAEVVIPLGGASPETMVSVVEASDEALAIKVTTFDAETETESEETIKVFGAVTGIDASVAGVVDVAVPGADGTVAHTKQGMIGSVINAAFDEDTQTITLPVVTGVAEDGTATTQDVTIDLKAGVVGAFVDVVAAADTETASAKYTFSYKQEDGSTATKEVFETGVRKVALDASNGNKVVVTKADTTGALTQEELLVGVGSVMSPTYDADTRKITLNVLQADGSTSAFEINLGKDMVVKSGSYNTETKDIELVLTDDSVVKIPAASLVDIYTGGATTTATVTVGTDNVVTVEVKLSTKEGNLLKKDDNGLYVVEEDFTATKQLIVDAQAAAEKHADDIMAQEVIDRNQAIADAIAQEVEDRNGAIATAKGEANTYADGLIAQEVIDRNAAIGTAKEEAVKHADDKIGDLGEAATVAELVEDKVSAAEQAAKDYADEKMGDLGEAENLIAYIDQKAATAESNANGYTDGKIAQEVTDRDAAIKTAKEEAIQNTADTVGNLGEAATVVAYVEEKLQAAGEAANGYTDQKVGEEAAARDTAIATAKGEANTYADGLIAQEVIDRNNAISTTVAAAKGEANTYTDGKIAQEVIDRDAAIATAKGEANTYTDGKIAQEVTDRDAAIATAKGEANTYTDGKIAQEVIDRDAAIATAKGEANTYTDGKIAQEVTDRDAAIATAKGEANTYTDGKIAQEVTDRDAAIATAKGEANTYTDDKIGDIGESATVADYVNAQIAAASVKWIDFSDIATD